MRNKSASLRASILSLLLPSFNNALRRGSHTSTWCTWGLQQIVEPSRPGPFFPGHMQLAPQTVDKLQNAAGFGFHNRLHHQLATAIEDSDHDRFLVHVHADILDVATHKVASLRERTSRSTESFPQGKVSFFSRFCLSSPLILALHPRAILHDLPTFNRAALS